MNTLKILFPAIIFVVIMTTCKKTEPAKPDPFLTITPENKSVTIAGTIKFAIKSNVNWTATIDQNWCTIENPTGSGDDTIIVTYQTNTSILQRSANLRVVCEGLPARTSTISQVPILDGEWEINSGYYKIMISGSTGLFSEITGGNALLGLEQGFIEIGSEKLKNIINNEGLSWTGNVLGFCTISEIVYEIGWNPGTSIMMSSDGNAISITTYFGATEHCKITGTYTLIRENRNSKIQNI
jgi:hypothetical protein